MLEYATHHLVERNVLALIAYSLTSMMRISTVDQFVCGCMDFLDYQQFSNFYVFLQDKNGTIVT